MNFHEAFRYAADGRMNIKQITLQTGQMNRVILSFLVAVCLFFSTAAVRAEDVQIPSVNLQKEIHLQLLEIAVANFDKSYTRQYMRLKNSRSTPDYGLELALSYLMVKRFRDNFAGVSWENTQNLSFRKQDNAFTVKDVEAYEESVRNGTLEQKLTMLRPKIPNYISYRREMLEQLKGSATEAEPYPFRLLKEGSRGEDVDSLKLFMQEQGYLDKYSPINGEFDFELTEAVKNYQFDKGLKPDGMVGRLTYDLIFKTHESKAVSIARTMIRMNHPSLYGGDSYVFVNIPKMEMNVYSGRKSVLQSNVVVGRTDRQTPRLSSRIDNVILNPSWTAPITVSEKDYLPMLRKDRFYLAKKGITIYLAGEEVDPSELTQEDLTSEGFKKFRIVQRPGNNNAMGRYKFNFPNKESIFLHSTNSPGKFRNASRMYSSGCVRVQKSNELAKYLLRDELSPDKVDKIIESERTTWLKLEHKVPIYLAYWTSYIAENGKVYYLPDIYSLDVPDSRLPADLLNLFK